MDYCKKKNYGAVSLALYNDVISQAQPSEFPPVVEFKGIPELQLPIDTPDYGFLYEWWTVFWDLFKSRNQSPCSGEASVFMEVTKLLSDRERARAVKLQDEFRHYPVTPATALDQISHMQKQKQPHPTPPMPHPMQMKGFPMYLEHGYNYDERRVVPIHNRIPNQIRSPYMHNMKPMQRQVVYTKPKMNGEYYQKRKRTRTESPLKNSPSPTSSQAQILASQQMQVVSEANTLLQPRIQSPKQEMLMKHFHVVRPEEMRFKSSPKESPRMKYKERPIMISPQRIRRQPVVHHVPRSQIHIVPKNPYQYPYPVADDFATFPMDMDYLEKEEKQEEYPIQLLSSLESNTTKTTACALNSNATVLASSGNDYKVVLWSTKSSSIIHSFQSHTRQLTCIRFCNTHVASAAFDSTLCIWNLSPELQSTPQVCISVGSVVMGIDFLHSTVCCIDGDGEFRSFYLKDGSVCSQFKISSVRTAFSSNPLRVFGNHISIALGCELYIIDAPNGIPSPDAIRSFPTLHKRHIHTIDWSLDGKFLLTASEDCVVVWDSCNFVQFRSLPNQSGKITSATFVSKQNSSPEFVVFGQYESLFVWNFSCSKTPIKPLVVPQAHLGGNISCLASGTDPDGKVLLSSGCACKEQNLKLWTFNA